MDILYTGEENWPGDTEQKKSSVHAVHTSVKAQTVTQHSIYSNAISTCSRSTTVNTKQNPNSKKHAWMKKKTSATGKSNSTDRVLEYLVKIF